MHKYVRIPAKYRDDPRRYFVRVHLEGQWRCFCALERRWVADRVCELLRESFPGHDVEVKLRRDLLIHGGDGWRGVAKSLEQTLTDWDERQVHAVVMAAWNHPPPAAEALLRDQVRDAFEGVEAFCRQTTMSDEAIARRLALPEWVIAAARADGIRTGLQRRHR